MSEMTPEDRGIHAAPERLIPAAPAVVDAPRATTTPSKLFLHPKTTGSGLMSCVALLGISVARHWVHVSVDDATATTAILGFIGAYLAPWVESVQPGGAQ